MPIHLNHTIVSARDAVRSAEFVSELLGLKPPYRFGPFMVVETDNDVSLDYRTVGGDITSQHYAFLISEAEFDEIFGRITERGIQHWADPGRRREGQINRNDGGRGVYFQDLDGHMLEIITRPYGSGS